ncbi:cuticle collagen dpy-13-like [Corticium candelabrum]|uniref:cuticle collagen dpy-13-like n=1 Tax=Corticium candelabrum TaxID=121492 RepID=UPI002E2666FD|nr:cuticle collagen dpy-13-like [Corticium candelabrum]
MGSSGSDKRICVGNPTCWLLLLLTASLIVNVVFAVFGYLAVRNLQNNVRDLQNDVADVQGHLTVASEVKEQMSEILSHNAADRQKRSGSFPTSSSRLAADVGTMFISVIRSMCRPDGAVCIPGKDGLPGRDGLPGTSGVPGKAGSVGLRGPPGKPGAKGMGLPGKQGPIGIPGGKGEKGGEGVKGNKGERGYTGYKGERGMRGEKGDDGIQGEQGEKGESRKLKLLLPNQCNTANHQVLSDVWRKASLPYTEYHRDGDGFEGFQPGWHVFAASIGGQMTETCPPTRHCGAVAPGWLNGSHPTVIGQTSKESVCFHYKDKCCFRQVTVDITNCGQFYVYNLPNEPYGGSLVYCSNA